ncbi:MAG: response regulator transcription factor [Ignavibacteria bacterium]|nr:response regulator transcription factor [Ignavibacteria bacterium]
MQKKILLVDDEQDIIEFLQFNLEQNGYKVISANDGEEALKRLNEKPDLVILDVMMPRMNGYQVFSKIRSVKEYEKLPIIFLTAKTGELDEIHGLELGAEDYILKPISQRKIIARVNSVIRRTEEISNDELKIIQYGPLLINKEQYLVFLEGEEITFPKKEFSILSFLAEHPGKVFPRETLLNTIWGNDVFVVERTVDVHIRKIREKLGEYADLIETLKGVGYRFRVSKTD